MKLSVNPKQLPLLTLGAGGLCFVLRLWYFASRDAKGLLASGHFANTLCYLVFAAALAVIVLCVHKLPNGDRYQRLFPASVLPAIGCGAGALGILYTCISEITTHAKLAGFGLVVGVIAAVCLVLIGLSRFKGQRPSVYLFAVLALYLIVHVLIQVREWNKESQQSVIFFPLLASLFLLVCTYFHANLTLKQEGVRRFVFFQNAALLLCCISLKGSCTIFYLGMAIWLGLDLCLPRKTRKPSEET